jgi:uncharacterized protein (TIGR02145 family)
MSFKLGNINISGMYVGSNKIAQAYLGSTLVYQLTAPSDYVVIGGMKWKSKNLEIDDGGGGIVTIDNVSANGVNFGTQYYYNWSAAVRVADSIPGWHLPTYNEIYNLYRAVGGYNTAGTKLKSTSGWNNNGNGTDDYGFNALPVGIYYNNLGSVGSQTDFWSITDDGGWKSTLRLTTGEGGQFGVMETKYYLPLRLVKD